MSDVFRPFGPAIAPIQGGRRFAPVSGLSDLYDFWSEVASKLADRLPEPVQGLMAEGEPILPAAADAMRREIDTIGHHLRGNTLGEDLDPVDEMAQRAVYNKFMARRYGKPGPNDVYLPPEGDE